MAIDRDSTLAWMQRFAAEMAEHRQELVRLDTAIGDGDHGTNMDRGMQKALEKLQASEQADPGAVLKTVAMALISSVGGAAGPLYGTLLLQIGTALAGQAEVDQAAFAAAWRKGLEGVQARGKAQSGDKTMVDALTSRRSMRSSRRRTSTPVCGQRSRPPSRACTRRPRSSRARDGPATSASAVGRSPGPGRDLHLLPLQERRRGAGGLKGTDMPKYAAALDQGTTSSGR